MCALKRGEVLVCDAADPNMPFVVPLAAAVVECRGGMLIHGAISAREYGLPCAQVCAPQVLASRLRCPRQDSMFHHSGGILTGEATFNGAPLALPGGAPEASPTAAVYAGERRNT